VLVNGGERSLVANLGAANHFKVSHLDSPESQEIINRAKIYYISGFFLTVCVDAIVKIATQSVAENKIFAMNLSAPFLIDFFGDQVAACLPL
jgi:adenosine kinase